MLVNVLLGISIIFNLILIAYTIKRYKIMGMLNIYLDKVLAGEYAPEILDQCEGEVSILKANIYKATTTLKYQKELLNEDKVRMADAIADISHQLKTPLTSMMVMNDLLKTEEDPEKVQDFLSTQSHQLDKMQWLIQTLLKLSKLDAGTIEMKRDNVSAIELIDEAAKAFEIQMDLKDVKYSFMKKDVEVCCDKNWTLEAIQNIIKNCIEHMDLAGELKIDIEDNNLFNEIRISDNGCGISKEDMPHIFERFYKGANAGKDSVGIGLALAKTIMESQRGDIFVESTEGVGSVFKLRFYKTII
ncbi:MAG: HAMP domain-containing histidine kinase [Pseudobutyrivibrio sp.]|nr:HAMP domain-containing histidine kinase [Pseudobutyrivibrio sp.]